MDVGGRHAGSVSGSMNMFGNLGAAIGAVVVGYILTASKVTPDSPPTLEGWGTTFLVAASLYFIGTLAWLFIDPVTPLQEPAQAAI
jgi:Na+/melibiose symporter-like transporter